MSHHVAVFATAVGQTANTVLPAIPDQILPIDSAGNFLPQANMQLIWATAMSATANRAQLVSPAYRQVSLPYVRPLSVGATFPSNPSIMDLTANPLAIPAYTPLGMNFTSDKAMGTENAYGVIALRDQYVPPPVGNIYTLRATGTTALTANLWTQVALTWDQSIIQGTYAVVGGDVISATGLAWRITMDNYYYRPGGLAFSAFGSRGTINQYVGGWGEWGRFWNTSLPRLEVFATAADTAETLFLQVVKVG